MSFLLEKIDVILKEETDLLKGVRDEIESIKYELDHIKAFLRVAESMEGTDPQSRVWIKQVREIAFDIEDVIDEFTFRLAGDSKDGLYGYISKVRNVSYRRQIAVKLRSIKSRIDSVSSAHQKYKLDPEILGLSSVAASDGKESVDLRNEALLLQESDDLVGTENPKNQLIRWLIDGDLDLAVISVVGMAGLGKTSLVKQVYDDSEVVRHFNNHIRIVVSLSYKIEDLLKDMIRQINEESNRSAPLSIETMSSSSLKATVKNLLQQSRYLLVLDDVWHVDFWNSIRPALPRNEKGSRVMITTRTREVAHAPLITFDGKIYNLEPLSFESSWNLFRKIAFQNRDCPPHLLDIARNIIEKCRGLPLAVVTISAVLAKKIGSKIHEWEMVNSNLGNEFESMRKILLISYYDLPFYLKACFLYFTIFPEDYAIDRMMLIRLWISERFVEEKDGRTLEDIAESYLDELLDRSLIQVASMDLDGTILAYHIHDLLREVILTKAKEQDFVLVYNGSSSLRRLEGVRRLAIHNSPADLHEKKQVSRLRSLLFFRVKDCPLEVLGNDLKLIQVLDLSGTELTGFPDQILKLSQLKYLSLKNTSVSTLPESIQKLRNLETLDLQGTYVRNLPYTIVKLRFLRHLLVFHYEYTFDYTSRKTRGFEAISGIGSLRSLQHLCYVDVHHGEATIQELGMLNQLRLLWIGNLRSIDGIVLCLSIDKLSDLRNLSIRSIDENEKLDLQGVTRPPKFLERLYLEGALNGLPHWISSLANLSKLCLRSSRLTGDFLKPIMELPHLVTLSLESAFDGEELYFHGDGFRKLNFLWLKELRELKRVKVEKGAVPNLIRLSVVRCKLLEKVPYGIEHFAKLQRLVLADVSEKLIRSIDGSETSEDFSKVKHIPNIDISYFKDGQWISHHL